MTNLVDRILESNTGYYSRLYFEHVQDFFVALVNNNRLALEDIRQAFGELIAESLGVAELVGARIALQQIAPDISQSMFLRGYKRDEMQRFQDEPTQTVLPRVTLEEAVDDFVSRTPTTIRNAAERTAARISELYSEGRAAAFVRAAEQSVTEEVQDFITRALREGIPEGTAGRAIALNVNQIRQRSAPWSEAYARMAFRTNVNTAVTAGRFRQVQDPDVRDIAPAFRYETTGDVDVRDNHSLLDGMIFSTRNTIWNRIAPPLGYNCRCQVAILTIPQLRRLGRIADDGTLIEDTLPAGAGPDAGFRHGGRPDLFLTGAT